MSSSSGREVWIYHERQSAALCGQHALNNLVQASIFTAGGLAEIAQQLDQIELDYFARQNGQGVHSRDYLQRVAEGSHHVDEQGNFSIEVLRRALMNQYGLSLPNVREESVVHSKMDMGDMEGFICNRSSHWFAIRRVNQIFWNLNSTADKPEPFVSKQEVQSFLAGLGFEGYSVFCISGGLPPPATTEDQLRSGVREVWWRERDLLKGGARVDPWGIAGAGNRLDGKRTRQDINSMTEDEQLALAVEASLGAAPPPSSEPTVYANGGSRAIKETPPEPAATAAGAVRVQLRLPCGKRVIRRFLENDAVTNIYDFVDGVSSVPTGKKVELRHGFPPSDLFAHRDETLKVARLSGAMIQVRHVAA